MTTKTEITTKEAAGILGCTAAHVRALAKSGTLWYRIYHARLWVVDEAQVRALVLPKRGRRKGVNLTPFEQLSKQGKAYRLKQEKEKNSLDSAGSQE